MREPTEMELRVEEIIAEFVGRDLSSQEIVRDVIRAMREPTHDMRVAGAIASYGEGDAGMGAWHAMIDATSPEERE